MMSNNMRLVSHVIRKHTSTHAGSQTVDQRARRLPNIPRAHPPPHVTSAGCSDVSSTGYTRYRRDSYRLASASAAEGGKYITEVPCMISIQHAVLPSCSILLSQYCSPENDLRTICRKRSSMIITLRDKCTAQRDPPGTMKKTSSAMKKRTTFATKRSRGQWWQC